MGLFSGLFPRRGASHEDPSPSDPFDVARHGRPAVRVYTDHSGLPMNAVMALALDTKGYLWVGTQDGAAVYNGRVWRVVDMPDRTRSNFVRTILPASDGTLWFGTEGGGLARLDGERWTVYDTSSALPNNHVRSLLETEGPKGSRTLWAGTRGGLARFERDRWTVYDTSSGLPDGQVMTLLETGGRGGQRVLWVGTYGGHVARLERDRWTVFATSSGLPGDPVTSLVETAGPDGASTIWAGTLGGGLAVLDGDRWVVVDTSSGLHGNQVMALLETEGLDGAPVLWVGALDGGLARLERGEWTVLDTSTGLPADQVLCLVETPGPRGARALWAGTYGGGLVRLERRQWTSFDTSTGLPNNQVMSLLEAREADGQPTLWVGTYGGGLARLHRGEWSTFDTSSGLPHDQVMSLVETVGPDGAPALWVGTNGGGIARLDGDTWSHIDMTSGLPLNMIMTMLETVGPDGERTLWVGTYGRGLAKLERGAWTTYDTSSGLPNDLVTSLLETEEPDGTAALWVGTNGGGLARLHRGAWTTFDAASGLPMNQVACVLETRDAAGARTLWVGTYGGGIAWRDPNDPDARWETLSDATAPALPNNVVYQIREDRRGRLYLFTNKGVARLTPRTPTEDDPARFALDTFTTENGLPSLECNGGSSMVDSLGRIWIGTVGGAAVLDPTCEVEDRIAKPLYVERVLVGGAPRRIAPGTRLAYDENDLEFEVALLSYFRETDTRYDTQLVGFDRTSSGWSPTYRRTYTNLPAGSYRFRAWARDSAGNVSGPTELPFEIRPAPWRRWWAYLLYAGATAGVGYAGVRYRTESLKRQRNELEATVAARTAELTDLVEQLKRSEQKALEANRAKSAFLSNMSHELRTPLNAVLGFAHLMEQEAGRTDQDREYLDIIQKSGEHLLGLINDVLSISQIEAGKLALVEQPFDPHRLLREVDAMVRVRAEARSLALVVEVAESLPPLVRGDERKLRQVLLNLLGNAVKFTDEGRVTLRVSWENSEGGRASFQIEDTGPGISDEEIENIFAPFVQTDAGQKAKEGTGLGLAISRQIIRLLGGDIAVHSRLGHGTTFSFDVSLPEVEHPETVEPLRHVGRLAPDEPRRRLLVVDDTAENRLLLSRLLASAGFEVREAADGREALDVWEAWDPHMIWMDMRMPVMDGYEATREIRRREESAEFRVLSAESEELSPTQHSALSTQHSALPRHCRIVALTASAFEHDREAILECGCDDFVAKPFSSQTIFEVLSRHLGCRFLDDAGAQPADAALTPERLVGVDPETLEELRAVCELTDDLAALRVVDRIRRQDEALGAELERLVRQFDFDRLLELLAPTAGGAGSSAAHEP